MSDACEDIDDLPAPSRLMVFTELLSEVTFMMACAIVERPELRSKYGDRGRQLFEMAVAFQPKALASADDEDLAAINYALSETFLDLEFVQRPMRAFSFRLGHVLRMKARRPAPAPGSDVNSVREETLRRGIEEGIETRIGELLAEVQGGDAGGIGFAFVSPVGQDS